MNSLISPQAQQVLTLGRERHWGFRKSEGRGVMERETYLDGWWYLPIDSTQTTKADKRIEAIKNSGIRIRQVIIAHEAPLLLPAPKTVPASLKAPTRHFNWKRTLLWLTLAVGGIVASGMMVYAMVMVAYYILQFLIPVFGMIILVGMLGLGAVIDPVAIVVLECGTRIEVMRWAELDVKF